MPPSWSSMGTVINCSTSSEELPTAMVWISTSGGANSGKTSTLVLGIETKPRASVAAARNNTIQRNRRLSLTMVRISSASSVLTGDFELCAPKLDRANSHDFGSRRRPRGQDHQLIIHLFDLHGRAYV